VFLPQSDRANPALASALAARGLAVRAVTAYRTVTSGGGIHLAAMIAAGQIDAVTFASPSAVSGFIERVADEGINIRALDAVTIACIGPSTRRAAEAAGIRVHAVPPQATLEAWVASLEDYYRD
jgi:uroporphyrinogen-III synthase